jgi:anaerobic magnesium-protoporphyrin IX monomethyl ester cyclase
MKRYRILLINPPSPYLANDAAYPPGGLMYLAAAIERAGHKVSIIDFSGNPNWRSVVPMLEADLFGLTCVTPNFRIVQTLASLLPQGVPIIVGGPHPTFLPQNTLSHIRCDGVVQGEGESAVLEVIEDMKKGSLKKVYRGGLVPVGAIPKPARHLLDLDKYRPGGEVTTPIYTSRGCGFRCSFCSKITGTRFRALPLQQVVSEIEEVVTLGYRHIVFGDDNTGLRPRRLRKLFQAVTPLHITFRLNQDVRGIGREMLSLAKKAGCTEISFGIESGSQGILDRMNKQTSVENNKKAIWEARSIGIKTKAYFIVNFPGETEETVGETLRFAEETRPDQWLLSSFAPLPGSDAFWNPSRYGITWMSPDWEDYYLVGKEEQIRPCFETESLTADTQIHLHEILRRGLKEILG